MPIHPSEFLMPIRSYNIPDSALFTSSLKSKAFLTADLEYFRGQVLLDVCFEFLKWGSCIGDALPAIR